MKWLLAFMVLALGPRAHAQAPVTARLVLESAPTGCTEQSEITGQVNALLRRTALGGDEQADLRVELRLRLEGDVHIASVRLLRLDGAVIGTREIISPGPECSSIVRPLALILAMMIDLPRTEIEITLPPPEAPSSPELEPEPVLGPEPEATPTAPWGLEVGLGGFVSGGALSAWDLGPRPAVRVVTPSAFSLEIAFSWLARMETTEGDFLVETEGYLLEVSPCLSWRELTVIGVWVCAGVAAGSGWATGIGFDENHSVASPLVEARARVDLTVPLHEALALRFGAGVAVGILSQNLVYETAMGTQVALFSPWPARPFGLVEVAWTPNFGGE